MHLIDHEDLEAPLHRFIDRLLQQSLHLIHAPIGSRIELGVIHKPAQIDVRTRLAHPTRCGGDASLAIGTQTVQRLGQNARHRRFANTPGAGKQVCMVQPLRRQRICQRPDHVLLPHHAGKILRAILSGEHKI